MNRTQPARLLILDSQRPRVDRLTDFLERNGVPAHAHQLPLAGALETTLRESEWDLILIHTPDFSPLEACLQTVREHTRTPSIPVLAYGPPQGDAEVAALLAMGFSDYLDLKRPQELRHRLMHALDDAHRRKRLQHNETTLREYGDLFLSLFEPHPWAMAYLHGGMHIITNRRYRTLFGHTHSGDLETIPLLDLVSESSQDVLRDLLHRAELGQRVDPVSLLWRHRDGHDFRAFTHLVASRINHEPALQITLQPQPDSGATIIPLREHPRPPSDRKHRLTAFLERLEHDLRTGRGGALLLVEAIDLTQIKESAGVLASEAVLQQLQDLIDANAPSRPLRLGGGVFALWLPGHDEDKATALGERLCGAVEAAIFETKGQSFTLTVSIGVALAGEAETPETLITHADVALTLAHAQERERIHRYHEPPATCPGESDTSPWRQRLEHALAHDGLRLAYLPIVALHAGPAPRYEALLRLRDEAGRLLSPAPFLYPAEQAGLAPRLDHWVIDQALARLHAGDHPRELFVKLNVAALRDDNTRDALLARLKAHPEAASRLVLEINEADAAGYLKAARDLVQRLRRLGARSALEHFGTLPESLRHLRHLPVDYLKIDASLVHGLGHDSEARERVRSIVAAAAEHGMETIAEGVESADALDHLWRLRVDHVQGYYLRQPGETLDYDFDSRP